MADKTRDDLPLLAKRSDKELFAENSDMLLPSRDHECLVVNCDESGRPTFVKLDAFQSSQLSDTERRYLGFVPTWARRASTEQQYQLGLLPPPGHNNDDYWTKPTEYQSGWRPNTRGKALRLRLVNLS